MESEGQTRKTRIDPLLRSLGWNVVGFDANCPLDRLSNCAIEEDETENGPADYVLWVDCRIVAVVEAKKLTLGSQNVLTQAERYSREVSASKLNFDGFRVPLSQSKRPRRQTNTPDSRQSILRRTGFARSRRRAAITSFGTNP